MFKRNLLRFTSFPVRNAQRTCSIAKQAVMLSKIIKKSQRRSLKQKQRPSISMNDYARRMLYSKDPRRIETLNKIFMEHISDMTAAGDYSDELINMGIHVVQVKMSHNYHILFVYWINTLPVVEEKVHKLLVEVAGYLRFQLSSLKVMSIVPEIRFVRQEPDPYVTVNEIINELKLSEETEQLTDDKKTAVKNENHNLEVKVKTYNFDDIEMIISNIKQNIYGLDREKILKKINDKKADQNSSLAGTKSISRTSIDGVETFGFDKKALKKSIYQRHFDLLKQRKNMLKMENESFEMEEENFDDNYENMDKIYNYEEEVLESVKEYDIPEDDEVSQPEKTS